MKKTSLYLFFLTVALALCAGPLSAGAPLKINFQGRLDESGVPAEGSKNFVFKLYDAVSGGNLIWTSQTQSLTLTNGVFSAVLSAGTPAALSTAAFSGARYVEMTVDGVPLSPRQEMVSAPYALVAQALAPDAVIPAAGIAAGSVNDSHVVLSTAAIGSGKFGDDRVSISTGAFYGGFNGNDQLVRLDGTGKLPAADASLLTNLPAPSGVVAKAGDTMTGQLTLAGSTLTVTGNAFSVGLTTLTVAGGYVGIGTAAPNYKLDVQNGSINASGGLCIADNCKSSWASVDNLGSHTASQALNMAGFSIHNVSTLTVAGNAFSVAGSTLTVANGRVGVGTASPNSTLGVGGSLSLPIRLITASDAATAEDYTILADSSGGPVTITLPAAASAPGRVYMVKRVSALGSVVVDSAGGLVEFAASQTLNSLQGETVILQSDGTDWYFLNWYWQ